MNTYHAEDLFYPRRRGVASKIQPLYREMMQSGTGLRQELRDILSSLNTQIRAGGSRGLDLHRSSAHVAEISCIRSLVGLSQKALLGASLPDDDAFMQLGQIRDSHDAASLTAREMKLQRDAAEEVLAGLAPSPHTALDALLIAESECTHAVDVHEQQHSKKLATGLSTCAKEITDILIGALLEAAPKNRSTKQRWEIGERANAQIEKVAESWLLWYQNAESSHAHIPPVSISPLLLAQTLQNPEMSVYVQQMRQCMHLRRQQSRLIGILTRIGAATAVGEIFATLSARIVLPH